MDTFTATMTGKGTGAIATIQLCGESAKDVLKKVLKPPVELKVGKIYVGTIADGNKTIDQVTIGCEAADTFAINCHGNPLIVEQIMQLLQKQGVELLTAEQLLCKTSAENNTIALEAKLTLPKVKTIEGTQIIFNQIDSGPEPERFRAGLTTTAQNWQNKELKEITNEAKAIIEAGQIAKLIIFGCRTVLAGPPNTGKSTLLNRLCGNQKAIVTNTRGTTRDWVSAECRIGPLAIEFFDTAGLDEKLIDDIDKAAQQAAVDIINQTDLILLVLDNNEPAEQLTDGLMKSTAGKKILVVINKSDLPCRFDSNKLPGNLASGAVKISALLGTGIDALVEKVCDITGVKNFDAHQPVCFTARQEQLLAQLTKADSKDKAETIITELLSGRLNV